jgi:predicted nucleotide-binding protein (sugar kinase/HSP70/actin superfamily)
MNILKRKHHQIAIKKAKPFLKYPLGGKARESIGSAIMFKEEGWDGMIHLYPFTCMPEIISRSILPEISRKYDLPILSLVLDEHTGEAGLKTRLEAYVDLLDRKKTHKNESKKIQSSVIVNEV